MNAYDRGARPKEGYGRSSPPSVPPLKVTYYQDVERNVLNPSLLDRDAEHQADALHRNINAAQVRRFFGEVKSIFNSLRGGQDWAGLEPRFRMLKSRAFYASGTQRIPKEFSDFLVTNVDQVKNEKDFVAFVQYFEAVLGFMYGKGLVRK